MSLEPMRRDAITRWAAECEGGEAEEGRGTEREGNTGPLWVGYDEGLTMSKDKSKSIAHMMVTIDQEYDFNDACAVDGSYLGRKQQASYGIWRGRGSDGKIDATSGAMPAGAKIQDAEMLAILECAKGTEERLKERRDESASRLLVLLRSPASKST